MKKFINLFVFLIILLSIFPAFAADKNVGLGAMVGSYTALSGEYVVNEQTSYDSSLAFDIGDSRKFHFHLAKLFHKPNTLKMDGQVFGWYYGLGARYRTYKKKKDDDDDYKFGARASAGLLFDFETTPLKIFTEGSFVFNFLPATDADLDLSLGLRYYF